MPLHQRLGLSGSERRREDSPDPDWSSLGPPVADEAKDGPPSQSDDEDQPAGLTDDLLGLPDPGPKSYSK